MHQLASHDHDEVQGHLLVVEQVERLQVLVELESQLLVLSHDLSDDLEVVQHQLCHDQNQLCHVLYLQLGGQCQLDLCLPLYHLQYLLDLVQELKDQPPFEIHLLSSKNWKNSRTCQGCIP